MRIIYSARTERKDTKMKVIKKGKTKLDRAIAAAKKFSSRVVCDECKSTLGFDANDLSSSCMHDHHKIVCPVCNQLVFIEVGGLPPDVHNYVKMIYNGEIKEPVAVEV